MNKERNQLVFSFRESDLVGDVTFLAERQFIVHKDEAGSITATKNRCKHAAGDFSNQEGCILTCSNHGWRLDVSKMEYANPIGIKQDQLIVERKEDGTIHLFEEPTIKYWETDPRPEEALADSEFTVRFYSQACMEVACGPFTIFTDPWLVGPALIRGWWLVHQPPSDWLDRLAAADAIYISHSHSDHLNPHSLRLLAERNKAAPLYVPDYDSDSCNYLLQELGFTNVTTVPFGEWIELGENGRFMILQDGSGRDDSSLLVEYKGHRLLDVVDCGTNLNNDVWPEPVDIIFTSFSGTAGGFPICWSELYSNEHIANLIKKDRALAQESAVYKVQKTGAKVWVPFANYSDEAHPSDRELKEAKVGNSADEVSEYVRKRCPGVATWLPGSGDTFDIGRLRPEAPFTRLPVKPNHNFDAYVQELRNEGSFEPLQTIQGVERYFQWAGFTGDLVLHVIETNEDFEETSREFFVDFSDLTFLEERPSSPHRYLRMKIRTDVFRHVLRRGLPWDEIMGGFQARFYREPDVYNFDFWDHFQNSLPSRPLQWDGVTTSTGITP